MRQPLVQTFSVEDMPFVTLKTGHHVHHLKLIEADDTLFVKHFGSLKLFLPLGEEVSVDRGGSLPRNPFSNIVHLHPVEAPEA